jgi:membrane protein DedA with SNARE-associated domain
MRRLRSWPVVAAVAVVAGLLLVMGLLEGDLPDDLTHLGALIARLLVRYGAAACFALLYVEESGIPLPVPGDVYVAYLGRLYASSFPHLVLAWLGIIAVVVAGSTNLYLVARRLGPALLRSRLLHLDESRVERAGAWFRRWGPLAIIFGRHLPGMRIPVTVIAATAGVRYRVFAPSVAVSTAVWAAVGLWVGATFGRSIAGLLSGGRHLYLVVLGLAAVALAVVLVRAWRGRPRRRSGYAGRP